MFHMYQSVAKPSSTQKGKLPSFKSLKSENLNHSCGYTSLPYSVQEITKFSNQIRSSNFSQHHSFIHGSQETTLLLYSIQYNVKKNSESISIFGTLNTTTPRYSVTECVRERERASIRHKAACTVQLKPHGDNTDT